MDFYVIFVLGLRFTPVHSKVGVTAILHTRILVLNEFSYFLKLLFGGEQSFHLRSLFCAGSLHQYQRSRTRDCQLLEVFNVF